jgi:hypothetical protein
LAQEFAFPRTGAPHDGGSFGGWQELPDILAWESAMRTVSIGGRTVVTGAGANECRITEKLSGRLSALQPGARCLRSSVSYWDINLIGASLAEYPGSAIIRANACPVILSRRYSG